MGHIEQSSSVTINKLAMKAADEEVILQIQTFNPLMTNGLSHPYHLGESIFIFRLFILFFNESHVSKQNNQRYDAAFFGVTPGAILFAYVP